MMRLCPKDGIKTEQERCPECGTATLVMAQNPDSKMAPGTEINGRYRIDKMIGQGGFGAVYKATHLATDQEMAIKVLGVSLDTDESDLIQRFFAEAQITAGLKHPNTIRVFDFGQTEGGALYIAMELLSGSDLNDILKSRKTQGTSMTEQETIHVASQVLRSLAEAHMAGLVHRDLKPHNIFLNEVPGDDPVVKVLDFGIAKRLGSNLTGTGQAFGTPNYMSPEQAQNRPVDARSDIYSLGVVMFQCVAMRCPFKGDNPLAVLLSHVTDEPPDLHEICKTKLSKDFVRLVNRALAKDPHERFESAIAMRKALQALRSAVPHDTVSVDTSIVSSPTGSDMQTPSAPTSVKQAMFASTNHGNMLEVGKGTTVEDATQAYDVRATTRRSAEREAVKIRGTEAFASGDLRAIADAVPASGPPQQSESAAVTLDGEGSGMTEAFMGLGEVIQAQASVADAPVADEVVASAKSKSSKGVMVLLALVVATAIALAVALSGKSASETQAEQAQAVEMAAVDPTEATAGATGEAGGEAAAAAGADAANTKAAGGSADVGSEGGMDAGPADVAPQIKTFEILLSTQPSGATVQLNGTNIGTTPIKLKVEENKPLTGNLLKSGYHVRDFFVLHTDVPAKTYTLNKKVVKIVQARPRPATVKRKKDPPPSTSALEERL